MSFPEEFETVELLRNCVAETRGVDAFALSLIKAERQMRRVFTYLIFQFPCFGQSDVTALRSALVKEKHVYFDGFMRGFDTLYPKSIKQLIGTDYDRLRSAVDNAIVIRNKIFHGQVTERYLSRDDLFGFVDEIMQWCRILADKGIEEFGYDGFGRNSYRKAADALLSRLLKVQLVSVADYQAFLKRVLSR